MSHRYESYIVSLKAMIVDETHDRCMLKDLILATEAFKIVYFLGSYVFRRSWVINDRTFSVILLVMAPPSGGYVTVSRRKTESLVRHYQKFLVKHSMHV